MIREITQPLQKMSAKAECYTMNSNGYNSSVQQDTVNTISLKWPLNICWFS